SGLNPSSAAGAGGTLVDITGTNFDTARGTLIRFGGTAAPLVTCDTMTHCRAVAPPGSGQVLVQAIVSGQQSAASPFTYSPQTVCVGVKIQATLTNTHVDVVSTGAC